jgi:translocator protein
MNRSFFAWVVLAVLIAACFAAGAVGVYSASHSTGNWYETLRRPNFMPPDWVFGPVWFVLYLSMAFAAWLVWRDTGFVGGAVPLGLFIVQLALNAIWPVIFFELHRPRVALAEMCLLWCMIAATAIAFRPVSRLAALLLAPYLAWVTFAMMLNYLILQLNYG